MGLFSRKKDKDEIKKPVDAKAIKTKGGLLKADPKKASMKDLYGGTGSVASKPADMKKEGATAAETGKAEKRKYGHAYRILVKPLVTEKAANLGAENKYVFAVNRQANKIEIAKAITEVYGIKPVSVNIIRVLGKKVRYGRITGARKDWKKAIVMLPAGKTINIYEGV